MQEQLTESDVKKIQEEIDYRKLVVRKNAIEAVKEARAQGDLSENFEFWLLSAFLLIAVQFLPYACLFRRF